MESTIDNIFVLAKCVDAFAAFFPAVNHGYPMDRLSMFVFHNFTLSICMQSYSGRFIWATWGVVDGYGAMIHEARLEKGLTQVELAEKCGTTKSYISRIENDIKEVRISTLQKIVELGFGGQLQLSIKL